MDGVDVDVGGAAASATRAVVTSERHELKAAELKEQGNEAFKAGDLGRAIDSFTAALEQLKYTHPPFDGSRMPHRSAAILYGNISLACMTAVPIPEVLAILYGRALKLWSVPDGAGDLNDAAPWPGARAATKAEIASSGTY